MTMKLSGKLAKNLLELVPDATIVVDAEGTIVFANEQAERTFGYSSSELAGKPVDTLLPTRLRDRHAEHRAAFAASPKPRRMGEGSTLYGLHKSGCEFPIEISLSPTRSDEGMLVVAAVRDATRHHDRERELIEANRAKSRLLAAASHDLRQPAQTLNLLNQAALRHSGADAALRAILTQQQAALDTMSALLASVLDVSKLDSGALRPAVVDCAIDGVLERLRSDFAPLAENKGIALIVDPTAEAGRTDPELLRRLLANLLSNAIRYTARGSVRVGCSRDGEQIAITVRDTGIGIPSGELGKIFDEFYQVDRGTQRPEGLGLGLAIVRRLAALLDHTIDVESIVNEGTAFTVGLPRATLPAAATRETAVTADARAKGRILIVEDELPVAHATSLLLELEGFEVNVASCKTEALAQSLVAAPDVIISDYYLRGNETGAEIVAALRERLGTPIPVIFVTGDTSKLASANAGLANASLLNKPTQVDELLGAIRQHLADTQAGGLGH